MAYDEGLAQRISELMTEQDGLVEKKMFGGLAFMVYGHMCCGVIKNELMVRVGKDAYPDAMKQPHAREMDFTGKAIKGMVYISEEGVESDEALQSWLDRGLAYVTSLPPK